MAHNYFFAEGGTGIRFLLASYHYLSSKAYAKKGPSDHWNFICETLDAGGEEIGELKGLPTAENNPISNFDFYNPSFFFAFLKLADSLKKNRSKESALSADKMTLEEIAPDFFKNELLLTKEELQRNIYGGCYRDGTLGSYVSPIAKEFAVNRPSDKLSGFQAIVNDVIASANTYEVRVVFGGNTSGGEGKANICLHPALLKELCIKRVMEQLSLQEEQAKAYVENVLKIAIVATGCAFCFPATKSLNQNISGLVSGTLNNFPEDTADAVNLFYLLEHDCCPVQADKASDHGEQHKHAHAIELVAVACIENFFTRTTKDVSKKQCPVYPHYSLHGGTITNWENLGLPDDYRVYLSTRLRFDAALIYWVYPDLMNSTTSGSEILARMLNVNNNPKSISEAVKSSEMDIEEDIIIPLKALMEKEKSFLRYLKDICYTGRNWETGSMPSANCGTYLFDVSRIEHMLSDDPEIKDYGNMSNFHFDQLTLPPANPETGIAEDSIYHSKLTMDQLRRTVVKRNFSFFHKEDRKNLMEILDMIYDICNERKERR